MTELNLDFDYIANNIQQYIDEDNFYDILEMENIPKVLRKATLDSNNFQAILSQGKPKYGPSKLFKFIQKCNVTVDSYDDAINVLKSYKRVLKLKSANSLIDFLKKYSTECITGSKELADLNSENQNLRSKVETMGTDVTKLNSENQNLHSKLESLEKELSTLKNNNEQLKKDNEQLKKDNEQLKKDIKTVKDEITQEKNTNDQLFKSINDYGTMNQLRKSGDFDAIYNFLNDLSSKDHKIKISIACALGLCEKKNSYECTSLLWACVNGNLQLVKSLVEGGCDRNACDKFGNNCFIEAASKGYVDIVRYLVDAGFDKNWRIKSNGFNAILNASQDGKLDMVKYLISIGCSANSKQNGNANCLYFASLNGHLEVVKYLVSVGGNPKDKDNDGFSSI